MTADRVWLQPGDAAPPFDLPAVTRDGRVRLDDYVGRTPVLVGLFRGLHCPFCRRQVALFGRMQERLQAAGVELLAVMNTTLERARLYFRYRPVQVLVAADADAATHRAFGAPAFTWVEEPSASRWPWRVTMQEFQATPINPTGELPAPLNGMEANVALNAREGFELTEVDERIFAEHGSQLAAHYLVDRQGIIRWVHVEAAEGIGGIGKFPGADVILEAARALP